MLPSMTRSNFYTDFLGNDVCLASWATTKAQFLIVAIYPDSNPQEFYANTRGWMQAKGASWQGCEYYVDQNKQNKDTRIYLRLVILFFCVYSTAFFMISLCKKIILCQWMERWLVEDNSQVREKVAGIFF